MIMMNEKEAIDAVMNCLIDCNLRHPKDYVMEIARHGCFHIMLCPHRYAVLDIQYFYDNIPDIIAFKIKQKKNYVSIILKIRIRGD